jgi:Ca2+-transporting ATPase
MTAYRHPVADVAAALDTDAQRGLSHGEARRRLDRYGRNELTADKRAPGWCKLLPQFRDVLVVLSLVATATSAGLWLYERDSALPYEAMAIAAVVAAQRGHGLRPAPTCGASGAASRHMSAANAHVIRDGTRQTVAAAELVPGDITLVEEGDTIPADARARAVERRRHPAD